MINVFTFFEWIFIGDSCFVGLYQNKKKKKKIVSKLFATNKQNISHFSVLKCQLW
ncbi:hypothetical protein PHJA_000394700, partial [Phtheirospermum japonicum]